MFLPQKPYMVPGSLRAQLMYPLNEGDADDQAISGAIEKVNLMEIYDRVDGDLGKAVDWTNVLSLGEQQRVAFARLFLKKPAIAFLDEATSALDEDNECLLYERLRESGIAFVSIGHRSTLKEFHDTLLVLNKDCSSEITSLKDGKKTRGPAVRSRNYPIINNLTGETTHDGMTISISTFGQSLHSIAFRNRPSNCERCPNPGITLPRPASP